MQDLNENEPTYAMSQLTRHLTAKPEKIYKTSNIELMQTVELY